MLLFLLSSFALGADLSTIVGTWNVTATQTDVFTCSAAAGNAGSVIAYVWIASGNVSGSLSVSAQGETAFPKLTGTITDDHVVLSGPGTTERHSNDLGTTYYLNTSSFFDLKRAADGSWTGYRRYLGTDVTAGTDGIMRVTPCFIDFAVVVKR